MRQVNTRIAASLSTHPEERALLEGIVANPDDEGRYLILADWLDERDDPRRAELLRLHRSLLATCREPEVHPERAGWQVRPCVPRRTASLDATAMEFAWCPPGTFLMGSPPNEEKRNTDERQHRVTLTRGFWLGVTLVTQAQWQAVMGGNPSYFKGENLPVERVSWDDCQEFCKKLAERAGKHYRSPTEAEWEYACRAGTTTPFHFGATISTDQANYNGNRVYAGGRKGKYRQQTTPVDSFPANPWGLRDVHGNVWEWCQDWYGRYLRGDVKDPIGPKEGKVRVLRGGSWSIDPSGCRSAIRAWTAAGNRDYLVGCRLVLCMD
jgi:uncharacterized protein (TIGR02996 family)